MPPSISAALIKRRGIEALTLPQLTGLYENRAAVEKILAQFEEIREAVLVTERAAQETITEAETRLGEIAAAETALAEHTAEAEEANTSRVAETEAEASRIAAERTALDEEKSGWEQTVAAAHAAERNTNHAERRLLTEVFKQVRTIIDRSEYR